MNVSKTLVWAGILLILATGAIHLVETPHHFEEAKYVGVLFVLNGIGSVVAAVGIYLQRGWAWWLGAFIAAFSIISYIISRTVSLPGTEIEDWETVGIISLVVEAAFLLVFLPAFSGLRKGAGLSDK